MAYKQGVQVSSCSYVYLGFTCSKRFNFSGCVLESPFYRNSQPWVRTVTLLLTNWMFASVSHSKKSRLPFTCNSSSHWSGSTIKGINWSVELVFKNSLLPYIGLNPTIALGMLSEYCEQDCYSISWWLFDRDWTALVAAEHSSVSYVR